MTTRSSRAGDGDRGQRPAARQGHRRDLPDIVPTVPNKADVNEIVHKAVESALFNNVPAQQALTEAVAQANKLIE